MLGSKTGCLPRHSHGARHARFANSTHGTKAALIGAHVKVQNDSVFVCHPLCAAGAERMLADSVKLSWVRRCILQRPKTLQLLFAHTVTCSERMIVQYMVCKLRMNQRCIRAWPLYSRIGVHGHVTAYKSTVPLHFSVQALKLPFCAVCPASLGRTVSPDKHGEHCCSKACIMHPESLG